MKSKCGKLKNKGWKAEQEIDVWLNKIHNKEIKCNSRQGEYLLCEAKTCIQSLNSRIKLLNNLLDKVKHLEQENEKLKDDLCIGTLDNKHIDVYLSIDEVKKMCDKKILKENIKLFERVFELEEENERMKKCLVKIAEDGPDEMERERTKEGFINLAKECLDIYDKHIENLE